MVESACLAGMFTAACGETGGVDAVQAASSSAATATLMCPNRKPAFSPRFTALESLRLFFALSSLRTAGRPRSRNAISVLIRHFELLRPRPLYRRAVALGAARLDKAADSATPSGQTL